MTKIEKVSLVIAGIEAIGMLVFMKKAERCVNEKLRTNGCATAEEYLKLVRREQLSKTRES